MTRRMVWCVAGVCVLAAWTQGQAAKQDNPPPKQDGGIVAPSADPASLSQEALAANAAALLQQGDTNAALGLMTLGHGKNLRDDDGRVRLLLNTLLDAGQVSEAERIYRERMEQAARLTGDYFEMLHRYYLRQGDQQGLVAWLMGEQSRDLPPELQTRIFGWLVDASRELGPGSRAVELASLCVSRFDAGTSRAILSGMIDAYDGDGDLDTVKGILDAVHRAAGQQPELRVMVIARRVSLLFASGQWQEAEAQFIKQAPGLPEADLLACFQYAKTRAGKAGQWDVLDRLCVWILKEAKDKPLVRQAAAYAWMDSARERMAAADLPARLESLMRMTDDTRILADLYYRCGDPIMKDNQPAAMRAMIKIGESLAAKMKDKYDADVCRCKVAEYYFLLEDYAAALRLLQDQLAALEPKDQENLVHKIKAHQAVKNGNQRDAIKYFRAFMENVKQWPVPERSVLLDIVFSKEMCLGLTARRIGDAYAALADAGQARAAYQEADDYYAVAEKEYQQKSKESEYIRKCRAELASLLKK